MKNPRSMIMGNAGFTLMELLIVIVILGFLLGMVVPRLASVVSGDSVDTVCDTNNKGVRYYTKMYLDQKGRFPSDLTNLVNFHDSTGVRPLVEDKNTDNGPETLALDFYTRNHPVVRTITENEATELVGLGISYVRNLNDAVGSNHAANAPAGTALGAQTDQDVNGRPYAQQVVESGLAMAFVGDITTAGGPSAWTSSYAGDYPTGNPNWFGRIILGVGKDCGLVKDGYIQAAALCPGGIQNADNVTFNNYCIILPRLEATLSSMATGVSGTTYTMVDADNTSSGEQLTFTVEAQESWEFDFTCPEGHKWPDNDNDTWVMN